MYKQTKSALVALKYLQDVFAEDTIRATTCRYSENLRTPEFAVYCVPIHGKIFLLR